MILKIYKTPREDLQPDETHNDVWYIKIATKSGEVELRIVEEYEQLRISVDHQLIINPVASNTINVSSKNYF